MLHARTDYDQIQDPSGKIPDDEPVFLLRAQDALAPDVVEEWAWLAMNRGVPGAVVDAVRAHADRMRDWQESHTYKVPDVPEGVLR